MNSLVVKGFKIGTKNFASLLFGVFKAGKLGQNGGQNVTLTLYTLQDPHIAPGLLPVGFNDFLLFSAINLFNLKILFLIEHFINKLIVWR